MPTDFEGGLQNSRVTSIASQTEQEFDKHQPRKKNKNKQKQKNNVDDTFPSLDLNYFYIKKLHRPHSLSAGRIFT